MASKYLDQFRKSVAAEMERQGVYQAKLSERLGMPSGNLSRYLGGKKEPTVAVCERIAEALGLPLFVLMMDDKERARWESQAPSSIDARLTRIETMLSALAPDALQPRQPSAEEMMMKAQRALFEAQQAAAAARPDPKKKRG